MRPPTGFRLEHAVGTTFTLHLPSVLPIPLAFAYTQTPDDDPIGVLNALRQSTDRIDIFCQAGSISMPRLNDLVALLEPCIHPVVPDRGLFHPKVWLLEFGNQDERRYRLIIGSRNLTQDSTWDAVASFDGVVVGDLDESERASNEAIAAFVAWLTSRSQPSLSTERAQRLAALAERCHAIRWDKPDAVEALTIHVLGIERAGPVVDASNRALIISPFVSDDGIRRLASADGETVLVSRPEQIDLLSPETLRRLSLRMLDDGADLPVVTARASPDSDEQTTVRPASDSLLTGLHAKVVVHDVARGRSRILIGSANATGSAWAGNVEVVAELLGRTKAIGVDATLNAMGDLVEEYASDGGREADPEQVATRKLERELRRIAGLSLAVAFDGAGPFTLTMRAESDWQSSTHHHDLTYTWRLVTRDAPIAAGPLSPGAPVVVSDLALRELTPFVVLELDDTDGHRASAILVARIDQDVEGRRDRIIAQHLDTPEAFARFLRLMLQLPAAETLGGAGGWGMLKGVGSSGGGMLELLMRAVGGTGQPLAELDRILQQMTDEERQTVLPQGFDELWANLRAATEDR
ncbi:hypothetical protein L332_01855 [Agrococcus pavilionensis RW1]|uniref:PLD phosphodiesterase domain-containing protein n=1 Tax=Agrococcus pavilionensis RW1 TaxID=1330458 RepID=U1MRC2_9MICO|nr:phospholipase D family protein [Agrococcus pavilionensis]ERG63200.1 hypothetical protein L332_01855 [Agrococcus pavilionensis RW1]